jgi:glycosyltransferase involved in cell wall biosynthesis
VRIAFVHEWIDVMAGSEAVLEAEVELFPGSPVFLLTLDPAAVKGTEIGRHPVRTSFLDRFPGARTKFRFFLPLMPIAVEQFDLDGFDVVVSNTKAVAHGALTSPAQLHVAYFNRTMRYAWDLYQPELRDAGMATGSKSLIAKVAFHYLRMWDAQAMQRPDVIVANSEFVRRRIRKHYRREARVIHPPVNVDGFSWTAPKEDFYVVVSRLVPYKRVDLAVRAFSRMRLPLKVIGSGPSEKRLRGMAGPTVEFLGWRPGADVRDHVERARAFVLPGQEDFGIAQVEAQAAGTPVIAQAVGGALETVVPGETGVLFSDPTVDCLVEAVRRFESDGDRFEAERIRRNAERFGRKRFQEEFSELLERTWERFKASGPGSRKGP